MSDNVETCSCGNALPCKDEKPLGYVWMCGCRKTYRVLRDGNERCWVSKDTGEKLEALKTLGQVAYETFFSRDGVGQPWSDHNDEFRERWETAARAVIEAHQQRWNDARAPTQRVSPFPDVSEYVHEDGTIEPVDCGVGVCYGSIGDVNQRGIIDLAIAVMHMDQLGSEDELKKQARALIAAFFQKARAEAERR